MEFRLPTRLAETGELAVVGQQTGAVIASVKPEQAGLPTRAAPGTCAPW